MPCNAQNTQIDHFFGPLFGYPSNTNFKGNVESQCNMVGALWVHPYGGPICDVLVFPKVNKGTNE
jgi:hypothetical protein